MKLTRTKIADYVYRATVGGLTVQTGERYRITYLDGTQHEHDVVVRFAPRPLSDCSEYRPGIFVEEFGETKWLPIPYELEMEKVGGVESAGWCDDCGAPKDTPKECPRYCQNKG